MKKHTAPEPSAELFEFNPQSLAKEITDYFDRVGPGLSTAREQQAQKAIEQILSKHRIEAVVP